ncbi:TAXI family TRAP transporter solute-binding subunit [Leisingera sp. S132]|uniref:TAXI family TRAP transporter solute-binding subunit n=1 Tax=Leisingera sp. S132 TaxID=2867016 RepID=UPI0021A39681|nr:TAXI family TRAP transporter solute-binding subunit [Leisingera sp. S132]UWQ80373.1 TAXI family TRAP transporter solute-binding subunit [Leisingera sp. S132]
MRKNLILATAMTVAIGAAAAQAEQFVTIGTGGVTEVYYPTGGSICRLMNKNRKETGVRCTVESTGGSVYNINTIREGELEFGVAQSDWQFHALQGTSKFEEAGPFEDLRAVFSVHAEPFNVMVRADAGIEHFDDLAGKRVNIGNPGSGQRGTMEVLMEAKGWTKNTFALASELKSAEQSAALCDNQIDAFIITAGHPSGNLTEAATTCDAKLVPVTGEAVDGLISDNAYYRSATIPGGMYRGTDGDVATFGVGATLVTSADVPDEAVYALVSSIFNNFDDFRKFHPAFASLTKEEMVSAGLSAPIHPGALKYYREQGLLE